APAGPGRRPARRTDPRAGEGGPMTALLEGPPPGAAAPSLTVSEAAPETAPDALAGFTIGVTATRRREEFAALLERRGARVVRAPAIRLVPLSEDADLLAATRACLAAPVDDVVVTTGVGFRGWMAAAEGWGLGAELAEHLGKARVLTRGPKARGAVRAAGLNDHWTPESES